MSSTPPSLRAGLVGHWPLNEGAGTTAVDLSGFGNHGTVVGPARIVEARGGALSFDWSNDYVDIGNKQVLDVGAGGFTLSAWVKIPAAFTPVANDSYVVISKWIDTGSEATWELTLGTPGYGAVRFRTFDGSVTDSLTSSDPPNIDDDKWHLVTATCDGTTKSIYIDGAFNASSTAHSRSTSTAVRLGTRGDGIFPYMGYMQDVRVYRRCLGTAEVRALHQATFRPWQSTYRPRRQWAVSAGGGGVAKGTPLRSPIFTSPVIGRRT